ncbi:hypothetical protein WV31_10620 [Magnetospirillum sp. ME-1]|uniref:tyrosine phosphatase family protein n=1 Tax=Magnetospirillum sp. ME-1 TaxID=1639348 RepID=UPI000A17DBB7|nr:hypothetical protein [Magnetospirillum sp. ME-1]ARJ66081.1 hypothetical protein WV31_10620 [Magnetospirillum sp. ME-1]
MNESLGFPFRIAITSRVLLEAAFWRYGASRILSLANPGKLIWHEHQLEEERHLTLAFEDTIDPTLPLAPRREHIEAILDFGRLVEPGSTLLIHCEAGISRSPAAGYLILAQAVGPERAAEALEEIHRVRDIAQPNPLMIRIGAEILGWPEISKAMTDRALKARP